MTTKFDNDYYSELFGIERIKQVFDYENDPITRTINAIIIVLREIFKHHPGEFKYVDSSEDTYLWLIDALAYNLPSIDKAPAVVLAVDNAGWGNIGIDQLLDKNLNTGESLHTDLIRMTINAMCTGTSAVQAQRLALQVMYTLRYFRKEIVKLGLFKIDSIGMSSNSSNQMMSPGIIVPDLAVMPVSITATTQEHWLTGTIHKEKNAKITIESNFEMQIT